jgi:hypothetical protein
VIGRGAVRFFFGGGGKNGRGAEGVCELFDLLSCASSGIWLMRGLPGRRGWCRWCRRRSAPWGTGPTHGTLHKSTRKKGERGEWEEGWRGNGSLGEDPSA